MYFNWTVRARRRLRRFLARDIARRHESATLGGCGAPPAPGPVGAPLCHAVIDELIARAQKILEKSFKSLPEAITIQDQLVGFRADKGVITLQIEVVHTAGGVRSAHVVKIGPVNVLKRELAAWRCCRPEGLEHDLVLLPLSAGYEPENAGPDDWMSIVYGDAYQFLGVDRVITLEEAALGAVLHDFPSLSSVGLVLWELYERLAHLLYTQHFEEDPAKAYDKEGKNDYVLTLRHLERPLKSWEEGGLFELRKQVNAALQEPAGRREFLDPVYYFRDLTDLVPWRDGAGAVHPPGEAARPRIEKLVPAMLRGSCHGDLHGRNVLVGFARGKALWPVVFDYEDMSPCNWIGWDFVKMETELKVRAYPEVFPRPLTAADSTAERETLLPEAIFAEEYAAARETERRHRNGVWPIVTGAAGRAERLRQLVLEVRHRAALHLGANVGRPKLWLEEYYFLLAYYGIYAGCFDNLTDKHRVALLVSAGVAAASLSWPRNP